MGRVATQPSITNWKPTRDSRLAEMRALSCAVVGTTGVNLVALELPDQALTRSLARLLKRTCPREFRGVTTSHIKLFEAAGHGKPTKSTSFELSLLPELLAEGNFSLAQSILSDWHELDLDSQLPASDGGGGALVHIVAVIPVRNIVCLANNVVVRVIVNKSASVGELKDEIKNVTSERIKIVEAKIGGRQLPRGDVENRRSPQVANFLRALAAKDEMDLSCTVGSIFGDAIGREGIHVFAVPCEIVIEQQYQTSANGKRLIAARGRRNR